MKGAIFRWGWGYSKHRVELHYKLVRGISLYDIYTCKTFVYWGFKPDVPMKFWKTARLLLIKTAKSLFLSVCMMISFRVATNAQDPTYCTEYDCGRAVTFYRQYYSLLDSIAQFHGMRPEVVYSMAAPEVSFYLSYRDKLETFAVELFYTRLGKEYNDFSIGIFQIKPSLFEYLEEIAPGYPQFSFLQHYEETAPEQIRRARLSRIQDISWAFSYMCFMHHLLDNKITETGMPVKSTAEKITLLAAAYNLGIHRDLTDISTWRYKQRFPRCFISSCRQFSYAEAALDIYQRL